MPAATTLPPKPKRKAPKPRPRKPPRPAPTIRIIEPDPVDTTRRVMEKLLASEVSIDAIFARMGITPMDVMDALPESIPDAVYADSQIRHLFKTHWPTLTDHQRKYATFTKLVNDAPCPPDKLYGIISRFLYWRGFTEASAIIALNIPNIIRTTITNALNFGELSQAERLELLRALGIVNTVRNTQLAPTIINNVQATAVNTPVATGMPTFEEDMDDADDGWSVPRLPAADGAIIEMPAMRQPIDADADDD
jgi:hypothetical protein